jgi:hypothetical protein
MRLCRRPSAISRPDSVATDAATIDDDHFDRLLDAIAAHNRLCRVMAMSWRIRRTAAFKLATLNR